MATPQETKWYDETTVELMAPTMLPELHLLKRVKPNASASSGNNLYVNHASWKKCFGFSNTRCFVAGKSEGAPLLGAVGGPQQGHGAPQVRMEMIETHTVCNQHVPQLPRNGKVQALLLLPFRVVCGRVAL